MRRNLTLFVLLTLSLVSAWVIIRLVSHFSPIQLTPGDYTYILSPPANDAVIPPPKIAKATLDYAGFITILLGLISALLATLGLGLAVLAVIGWNSISGKVEQTASGVIRSSISDGEIKTLIKNSLKEKGPLYEAVRTEARLAMYRGVESVMDDDVSKPTEKT